MKNIAIVLLIAAALSHGNSNDFTLIYTNNFDGVLKSCGCPGNELGGIAYLANYLDQYRQGSDSFVLVDNGDFLPMKDLPPKAEYTMALLSSMGYDAINIGDQEFWFGFDFFKTQLLKHPLPLINTTLFQDTIAVFTPYLSKVIQNRRVSIIGFMPNDIYNLVDTNKLNGKLSNHENRLLETFATVKLNSDINILLAHTSIENCIKIASEFKEFDIIVAAHDQKRQTEPIKVDSTFIVEAGKAGEYLGVLECEIENGRILKAVDLSIPIYPLKEIDNKVIDSLVVAEEKAIKEYLSKIESLNRTEKTVLHKNSKCIGCHFDEGTQYESTPHAHAYQTLANNQVTEDSQCLQCHTTFFARPGGFISLNASPDFRDVGCISCHIELAKIDLNAHAAKKSKVQKVTEEICLDCHTLRWSPKFDYLTYHASITHHMKKYVVKENDCLSVIAEKMYKNHTLWPMIFESNKNIISKADLILPGQKLIIPNSKASQKKIIKKD